MKSNQPVMRRTRSVLAATAVVVLLPATAAAAATGDQPAPEAQPAWVRATHLVPDLPQMDIDLVSLAGGGTTTVEGAGYGDVSEYVKVPAGGFAVGVRPEDSEPGSAPLLTSTLSAEPGKAYTIAALGTSGEARLVPLEDDLTPPAEGQARVRVLSAASGASAVDVTAVDGPVVASGAPFGSATQYAAVPAGRWTLTAAPAPGSSGGASSASAVVDVAAGSTYTLAVVDGSRSALALEPVADAAGASAVPVGGAATGAGGTAGAGPAPTGAVAGAAAGALLAVGGLALVRRARSPRR